MKKVLSAVAVAAVILSGSSCLAADGMYVKGAFKYVMPSDPTIEFFNVEADPGYGFAGGIGAVMGQFRIEGEIATQKTDIEQVGFLEDSGVKVGSGDVRMDTYMINGYFDIPFANGFGMYLTGGLGYGTATVSIEQVDGDDSGFAWKGGAGLFYNINSNMAIDVGYEYLTMDDAELDVDVTDLTSSNIVGALRYTF